MKHITQIVTVCFALTVAGCATQKSAQASRGSDVYVAQLGDTLDWIAKQHHLTIQQLKDLNPDMPAVLRIGQKLYVLPQASK
jgi:LysM repeat protein